MLEPKHEVGNQRCSNVVFRRRIFFPKNDNQTTLKTDVVPTLRQPRNDAQPTSGRRCFAAWVGIHFIISNADLQVIIFFEHY